IMYASFCANAIPLPTELGALRKLWHLAKRAGEQRQRRYPPAFILAGGKKYAQKRPLPDKNTKLIWAHTLDYDLYLDHRAKDKAPLLKSDYGVFLDEYSPFHPDHGVTGAPDCPFKEPTDYFEELNKFMEYFEKEFDWPIVISAHPRSDYAAKPDYFKGRQVIRDRTTDLVAGAKYVLAHGSTSINLAVLFRKPVTFLLPEKVINSYYGKFIANYAKQLGKKALKLGSIGGIQPERELIVDSDLYSIYVENYIKRAGSPKEHFWDIVADRLMGATAN
ncbi:hypothetical protein ACFL4J_00815, partial [Candidatus Margulisiibacteriota bacterium]